MRTGGTGGVYYPIGGALANLLSKQMPNMQATAQVTGGSVDNLKLIGSGQSEIGFSMADAAVDALNGVDKFKGNKVPVRTLMVLYPNIMHVVSIEGAGVAKMADLKGKRVSTGAPGSATEVMAFRVIEAAGLDKDKDMKRERLSGREVGECDQGPQDRCLFLGRGTADGGRHRSRRDPRREDQADRPLRGRRQDERQVQQSLRPRRVIKAGTYPGPGQGQPGLGGVEHPRHQ